MSDVDANPQPETVEAVPVEAVVDAPVSNDVIALAEHEDLEGDLKEIYDLVHAKVKQIVATGKFTAEHIRPLILNIIEIVQEYTKGKYAHIDGAQKKAMALNVLRHVIVDLHKNGQINQDQYEMILLSLEFFGGVLIDFGKIIYKKLVEVADDVAEHGCSGCCKRNFFSKKK